MALKPNSDDVERALRAAARGMAPGEKFPTVRHWMKHFGVSQSLVDRAFCALRDEGLVESHVGRGTFVTDRAALKTVLWVCGVDVFHGAISPYYSQVLQYCKTECARYGLSLDAAWLSNFRPEDTKPYCTQASLDRYAGHIFCGCHPEHELPRYVAWHDTSYVNMTFYGATTNYRVSGDVPQMLRTCFSYFKSRGHRQIAFMRPDSTWQDDLIQDAADVVGVEVSNWCYSLRHWTSDYQIEGYQQMRSRIEAGRVPKALFIQDDVVAQGATRALLEFYDRDALKGIDIAIAGSRENIVPLGMPVAYLVNDVQGTVANAVTMLNDRIAGLKPAQGNISLQPYTLLSCDEAAAVFSQRREPALTAF